jgi:trehalose 6-phosphate synthase/phosphatase
MKKTQRRLIIVTHRLPFELNSRDGCSFEKNSDDRFVEGMKTYLKSDAGTEIFNSCEWVGCAGFDEESWQRCKTKKTPGDFYSVHPLFIRKETYTKFRQGFCGTTLRPLFYYFPSFVEFDNDAYAAYEAVNNLFSETILSIARPGDTIWINDYELMLVPKLLRTQNLQAEIGFFLHTPFPSYEVFRLLHTSWKIKILEGMLGADIIGFQTHQYVQHFLNNIQIILGLESNFYSIPVTDRTVKAEVFSIGVDYNKFHQAANLPEVIRIKEKIKNDLTNKKIIFSVGSLDYSDGIAHRLLGIGKFLEKHPEQKGKFVLVMVVSPSSNTVSKFHERKQQIEELVGKINGKHSTLEWQPILYRHTRLTFEELTTMYEISDVGLVTPLRDGLSLMAQEYIAAKIDHGVLIISEWVNATQRLVDALMVNPMDENELAEKIFEALTMPIPLQKNKIKALQRKVKQDPAGQWINDFFLQLFEQVKLQNDHHRKYLSDGLKTILKTEYNEATARLIFLDYDGTLVPFSSDPQLAYPDEALLQLLQDLAEDKKNHLVIISGRPSITLLKWFGHLPLTLVSEHGAGIRFRNGDWKIENIDSAWKPRVYALMESGVKRTPGSFIEEKTSTLAWHYRNVDAALGNIRSRELIEDLSLLISSNELQIIDGNKVIEVRVLGINKGTSARKIVAENPCDFIMAFGDDKTDEDLFKELKNKGYTIKVGTDQTSAQFYLGNYKDVIGLLASCIDLEKKKVDQRRAIR